MAHNGQHRPDTQAERIFTWRVHGCRRCCCCCCSAKLLLLLLWCGDRPSFFLLPIQFGAGAPGGGVQTLRYTTNSTQGRQSHVFHTERKWRGRRPDRAERAEWVNIYTAAGVLGKLMSWAGGRRRRVQMFGEVCFGLWARCHQGDEYGGRLAGCEWVFGFRPPLVQSPPPAATPTRSTRTDREW